MATLSGKSAECSVGKIILMEFGNVPTGINKFVRRDELPPVGYEAWSTLAAGAAVHAYYAIGAAHNESMRKWFANSAFAAILFGLIGEIPQDDCSTHNDHSVRQSEVENIYSPDNRDEIRYDGNWIYGNWIEDEFGSLEDMGAIIDPEMFGDCILGMILPVVHYILTGSHAIEKLRIHDSQYSSSIPYYYLHTRVNKALCQCGISSENDQVLVINTTSSWVSKLKVLQIAMKRYQLNIQLDQ
ncbi:unnamed protein product [Heterobilharzia americana]|nr:unnamed protein product [Heterobilharzia americana]